MGKVWMSSQSHQAILQPLLYLVLDFVETFLIQNSGHEKSMFNQVPGELQLFHNEL